MSVSPSTFMRLIEAEETYSYDYVCNHIVRCGTDGAHDEDEDDDVSIPGVSRDCQFVLRYVPVSSLRCDLSDTADGRMLVQKYKGWLDHGDAPAVVLGHDNVVMDGRHRVLAARAAGKSHIKAFVPIGSMK
jgi:hypothetical protein